VAASIMAALLAAAPAGAAGLAADEYTLGRQAIAAARSGRCWEASSLASGITEPAASKVALWTCITRSQGAATFSEIARFVSENPDWPEQKQMRRRAEEAITVGTLAEESLAWFERFPPVSGTGRVRHTEALQAVGREAEAAQAARQAWIENDIPPADERTLLSGFGWALDSDAHRQRLDRQLWLGNTAAAERLLNEVDYDTRALASARIGLRRLRISPYAALESVPAHLQDDPGLRYEMVRWYRKQGPQSEARRLLANYPSNGGYAELWWTERVALARDARNQGLYDEAYALVRPHGLTTGSDYVDAEWLSGWLALRFLSDPRTAFDHFTTLYDTVRYPVSLARAGYWAGRAASAMGRGSTATEWYRKAAEHQSAFYGQLAQTQIEPGKGKALPPDPQPGSTERRLLDDHELARAARLLAELGEQDSLRAFLIRLVEIKDTPGWRQAVASLAEDLSRQDLAVLVSRRAIRDGHLLVSSGYPVVSLPRTLNGYQGSVEDALILAVIRQESGFDVAAVSSAGARGLMQLMPATARQVASKLNVSFSPSALTQDPEYNVNLGQTYLASLLGRFSGSYVLAVAGYNAGPARASRWLDEIGDPRVSVEEAVDWIEKIPLSETRNYVQRTMENLQVYRAILGGWVVPPALASDLVR
jgi:soluble lytic murein transglycosylase